ncbi:hypothetical protein J6590_037768 [Homalodisca vitripennis]|nr:hypothetical protein J6590_037768 [Homalodisca vitripennis]
MPFFKSPTLAGATRRREIAKCKANYTCLSSEDSAICYVNMVPLSACSAFTPMSRCSYSLVATRYSTRRVPSPEQQLL